jgi:general secretion pathway protein G
MSASGKWKRAGFTLIELMVVLAIVATLLSIVVPRYFSAVDLARETALKETLKVVRDAIDKHFSDVGKYPDTLDDLVARKYLRNAPLDPVTGRADSWIVVAPADPNLGGIADVRSGAQGNDRNGKPFGDF